MNECMLMADTMNIGFGRKPFEHRIKWVAEGVAFDDEYHFNPQQSSQWDGFRHHNQPAPTPENPERRVFHGGTTAEEIKDTDSPPHRNRILGQARHRRSWKKKGIPLNALTRQTISLDEVLEIAAESNITFQHGDIFFLRVGLPGTWAAMSAHERQAYSEQSMPQHAGIEQSERVLRFIWDNHFAAVASDAVSFEVFPARAPEFDLHHYLLAGWGGAYRGDV
ncbi:hypothetical protein N7533_009478 [Penicillium manginii]|uniref:uncharacterized protein n=1 Tax=Penicillium manginii TaxID=203109 RepID=UPI002547659A|nr:uncharacterized protein N7533_009478 [Penicillium manginii]KAJ5744608.1 hypothetical protein N7533_009478 [Penicillium manginii]